MANNRMQGQLRIATELEGRGRIGRNPFDLPSSGAAEAASSIANGLATLGREIGAYADHAAAVEGERAGRQAGLDPEFRPTRAVTIRGQAFDKAGLQIYATTAKIEIENDIAKAAQASGEDAAAFAGRVGKIRQAWLAKVPEEMRPEVTHMFRRAELTFNRQAARAATARADAETREALNAEVETGIKGLHQRAYALGLDAKADEILAQDIDSLRKVLGRTGVNGKPLVTAATANKLLRQAQEAVVDARLLGAFDRLPSIEEKEAFLERFEDDFTKSAGLAKFYDLKGFQRMTGGFRSMLTTARAEQRQRVAAVNESINSLETMAGKGFTPTPDQIAGLKARADAVGDDGLSDRVGLLEDAINVQVAARKAPPAAIEAAAEDLRARIREAGPSEASAARVGMLDKLASESRTQLAADPLGWADRVGYVQVAPLDFDNFEASLKARMIQAEDIAANYQLPEVRYLRPEEIRQLASFAAQGGDRMLQIAGDITRIAGAEGRHILREIWPQAPLVATLGGHVGDVGVTPVAQDVAAGVKLRNDVVAEKGDFRSVAPSANDARAWAKEVHGGALNGLGATEEALISATNTAYEVRARRRGIGATDPDAELWRATFRELLGERTINGETYGGIAYQEQAGIGSVLWPAWSSPSVQPVIVPPNVRADGVPELMDAIQTEDLARRPRYADGSTAPVSDVRRAKLKNAGDGLYFLALGDPASDDPMWLLDEDGEKYVLDLKGLLPLLGRRRPDLLLGGR